MALSLFYSTVLIANLPSCSNDNGGCSHICLSTFSGASCKCKDGFISQNNGQVCLGECQIDRLCSLVYFLLLCSFQG